MRVGLRIDVDTFRGTRLGVPTLCRLLAKHGVKATFFFCVGPDNMGRHLWRLIRPKFLWKMLRTRAAGLYGWDILFKGTFWPGPQIAANLGAAIQQASEAGHEIGLHAWDHHHWQARIDSMTPAEIADELRKGLDALTRVTGKTPPCTAAPSWKCNDTVLQEKSRLSLRYNSDCRGRSVFFPVVNGIRLEQPQIPATLPTYDEIVGPGGVSPAQYNEHILSMLDPAGLNVLTIHAEVEGIACADMFDAFLDSAKAKGCEFVPLSDLLPPKDRIPEKRMIPETIPGREGWVACEEEAITS